MDISFPGIACTIGASTIFGAGGFYLLTNWRLTKLESDQRQMQEVRERLIKIETILTEMRKERAA